MTKVSDNLIKCLESDEAKYCVDNLLFNDLYDLLYKYDVKEDDIPVLTKSFLNIGINPLEHMNEVVESMFYGLDIDKIKIPSNINVIRSNSFVNCTKLKDLRIEEGVKFIEDNAFANCISLEEVTIPDSATLDQDAFNGCNLKTIKMSNNKFNQLFNAELFKSTNEFAVWLGLSNTDHFAVETC